MKKLLSVLFAVCLCLTAFPYGMFASAETAPITTYDIDLTQDPSNCLYSYETCTATVENNNLVVAVNNARTINGNTATSWLSNYSLFDSGSSIQLAGNDKVLVKIVYKVTEVTSKVTIGVGSWSSVKNSPVVVMSKVDHTTADANKENTLYAEFSNVQTAGQYMSRIKVVFNGTGKFEISKIKAQVIDHNSLSDCSLVTYNDGQETVDKEYVVNGSTIDKTLPTKNGYKFVGWYNASSVYTNQVTAATTLYAGWDKPATLTYTDLNNVAKFFQTTGDSANAGTTAAYENGVLNVHISHDKSLTNNWVKNWFTNYAASGTKIVSPSKVTITVNYKVLSVDSDTYGAQIGIGASDGVNNTVYPMTFKKHTSADIGKSLIYDFTYTVNGGTYGIPKVDFAGRGDFEISSIALTVVEPGNQQEIDLSKSEKINGSKATMSVTPATENENLKIAINTYTYKLVENDGTVNYHPSQHWYGGGMVTLKYKSGAFVKFASNKKYAINVKYDVTRLGTQDPTYAPQIGLLYNKNASETGDNDEWLLSANKNLKCGSYELSAIVTENLNTYPLRLVFAGVGNFEVKEITIKSIDSSEPRSAVKYIDNKNDTDYAEFVKNGTAVADLDRLVGFNFGGWYNGDTKAETVTSDTTLTAKWYSRLDLNKDDMSNIIDLICLKKALASAESDLFFDVNRDNKVDAIDVTTIVNNMLGKIVTTINDNSVEDYSIYVSNKSFVAKKAAEEISDAIKIVSGVTLPIVYTETEKEIAIVVDETLEKDNYTVAIDDNNLVVTAGSEYAASEAANKIALYIKTNGIIPAGFTLSGEYDTNYSMVDNYKYAWGDEFDGNDIDSTKWTLANDVKPGPVYATDSAYYQATKSASTWTANGSDMQDGTVTFVNNDYSVNNGVLTMNTRKVADGYTGTKISANQTFRYGIMEAKIKFGNGEGGSYQFWARSKDTSPQEDCVVNEFDFAENFGTTDIYANLHTWRQYFNHTNHGSNGDLEIRETVQNVTDGEYHYIAMEWTQNMVKFYFDGELYMKQSITDQETWDAFRKSTYIIFGVDVPNERYAIYSNGTTPAEQILANGGNIADLANFSDSISIDYVRVYQLGSDGYSIS